MPRPQFSIRTLLWLTLVVAAFLGGMLFEKQRRLAEEHHLGQQRILSRSYWLPRAGPQQ